MSLILLLLACQEPFGSDRHTLEGFRIAGVRAWEVSDAEVAVEPLVVVDGRLWSEQPVDFAWTWLEEDDDPAGWTGHADQAGATAVLDRPARERELLLVAVAPDGTERRAVLTLGAGIDPRPIGPLAFEPGPLAGPGDHLTLSAPDAGKSPMLRWMGTAGTWFEQTPTEAEWTPDQVVFEDGEEVSREPGTDGIATLVALRPGMDWVIHDVAVGAPPTDGALVDGRWLPGAVVGAQEATLEVDPAASMGLRVATSTATTADLPARSELPTCDGPLLVPDWLATGACQPSDFAGRTVRLEGTAWP